MLAACSPNASTDGKKGSAAPSAGASAVRLSAAPDADAGSEATRAGRRIFNDICVACHQQNAAGIPGVYPSLARSPVVLGDPAALARWIIQGRRPAGMPAGRYGTQMPQFGWLKPKDAASLMTYIRSGFGNSAPAVDEATVVRAMGD